MPLNKGTKPNIYKATEIRIEEIPIKKISWYHFRVMRNLIGLVFLFKGISPDMDYLMQNPLL